MLLNYQGSQYYGFQALKNIMDFNCLLWISSNEHVEYLKCNAIHYKYPRLAKYRVILMIERK